MSDESGLVIPFYENIIFNAVRLFDPFRNPIARPMGTWDY
jgi:hypothetical protein